jgi:hypothetical protein
VKDAKSRKRMHRILLIDYRFGSVEPRALLDEIGSYLQRLADAAASMHRATRLCVCWRRGKDYA